MSSALTYHALRRVGDRVEEIRVTVVPGEPLVDAAEEHVAYHDDEDAAKAAIRLVNLGERGNR